MPDAQQTGATFVVNDMVIQEDNCNMACEYCLTGQSRFKDRHAAQMIFNPPRLNSCLPGSALYARLQTVLDAMAGQNIPVIKISGGEVLLIRGIMDLIAQLSACHETVVILTNGFLLTGKKLDRLHGLGNIVLQISLDATVYPGNSYRAPTPKVQDTLMKRLRRILDSGLPVEIYAVLNDRSIETLEQTLDDLEAYAAQVMWFPFPVRGPLRDRFLPRPEQLAHLQRLIDRAAHYGSLLPPRLYLARLWRFFTEGGRNFGCHLPRVALGAFDDGVITSCPNIWFDRVGNLLDEPAQDVFERLASAPFRRLLLAAQPRIEACKTCFTPWDPVSLYFEGELTLDELARVPMYRGPRTRARLAQIREAYLSGRETLAQHHYSHA